MQYCNTQPNLQVDYAEVAVEPQLSATVITEQTSKGGVVNVQQFNQTMPSSSPNKSPMKKKGRTKDTEKEKFLILAYGKNNDKILAKKGVRRLGRNMI